MRMYKLLAMLVTFALLMVSSPSVQAAHVENLPNSSSRDFSMQNVSPSACSNLDVVFIIDQSDSMSRNDPTKNRKYAVEGMIDLLVQMALYDCPGTSHRLGVISFGSEYNTRVDVEMYEINPSTADGARRIREELRPRIKAENLGQTYPEPAFEEAYSMFNRNALNDGEERKRVIIFITDGLPCGVGQCEGSDYSATTTSLRTLIESRFSFADDLKQREDCLALLRRDYPNTFPPADKTNACFESNDISPDAYENSAYIFTMLLHNSDADYAPSAVAQLEQLSHAHAGELFKNQSENQIPTTLRKILSQLMGIRPSLLNGPDFAVNPYLNKMIVTAYKRTEEVDFKLSYTDASGQVHSIEGGQASEGFTLDPDNGYYKFGANETYTILNPYPGIWSMSSTNPSGLDVFYQPIEADFRQTAPFSQVPQYEREPFYNVGDPYYLEFTLYDDSNGGAIVSQAEKALFAVDVQAVVTDPAGKRIGYELLWSPNSQSFKSDQPLQVPLAGTYNLALSGTTYRHEGEPVVDTANESAIFDTEVTLFDVESEFTGLDVLPVKVDVVSPVAMIEGPNAESPANAGNVHATILSGWPLNVLPIQVRVRLTDENGTTLTNTDAILISPVNSIEAQVRYISVTEENGEPSEGVLSEVVLLQPDPAVGGEFTGVFPGIEHEGDYTLLLTLKNENLKDGYWTYEPETEFLFTRTDCIFCRAGTYYTILGMIIALIFAIIVYNFAIRTNKVSGTLYFKDGAASLAEFGLYNGTNFCTIGRRKLDAYPHLALRSLKVYNTGKKRRVHQQQDAVTGGSYGDDSIGITIDYVAADGRRSQVKLDPGFPVSYSEETIAQMVYEPAE